MYLPSRSQFFMCSSRMARKSCTAVSGASSILEAWTLVGHGARQRGAASDNGSLSEDGRE
jgi:hypothetical protein